MKILNIKNKDTYYHQVPIKILTLDYFIEKNGDNWFFLLFIDRAFFIFPVVVMLYFGLSMTYMLVGTLISLLVFIYATPFRLGLSLSFDYYMRSNQRSHI